ncbi:DDE-type integrase/transposase/recombinase [Escherichia coli]|nr:DDE-type integrase/transposase/recombinase [Escherichia coli]
MQLCCYDGRRDKTYVKVNGRWAYLYRAVESLSLINISETPGQRGNPWAVFCLKKKKKKKEDRRYYQHVINNET